MMNSKDRTRCLKRLYSKFRASCKSRGIESQLTYGEYATLVLDDCAYCGRSRHSGNKLKYSGLKFRYNGIDRKDSGKGYTIPNCLTSCRFCNTIKARMKWTTWASFINDVVSNFGGWAPYPKEVEADRKAYFPFGKK